MHDLAPILGGLSTAQLVIMIYALQKYWAGHSEILERIAKLEGKVQMLIGGRD